MIIDLQIQINECNRQTDRQRKTGKEKYRKTDTCGKDRRANRWTNGQTDVWSYRQTEYSTVRPDQQAGKSMVRLRIG